MPNVVGIDLSSRAVDIVLLDENFNRASTTHIELCGADSFSRARDVRQKMPNASWFADQEVYLVAIERPWVRFGQDVIRLVEGAVLSCIPTEIPVWEIAVSQWKKHMGIPIREKPSAEVLERFDRVFETTWTQDAFDALCVAVYARDTNASGIERALKGAA